MPDPNDYLLTGDPSYPPVRNGKVTPLVDSHNYFPTLAAALDRAQGSGDFIYIMGWSLDWLEDNEVIYDSGIGTPGRVQKRHYRRRTGMAQHLQLPDRVVRKADAVEIEVDDAPGVEAGGGDESHFGKGVKGEK